MYKYKSRKRYPRLSKRFQKKVMDVLNHPMYYKVESLDNINAPTADIAYWAEFDLGHTEDLSKVFAEAYRNADAFNIADPNSGGLANPLAYMFKVHVLSSHKVMTFTNTSEMNLDFTFYEIVPRYDLNALQYGPLDVLGASGEDGDMLDTLADPAPSSLTISDYRMTPYKCPVLTMNYKIMGVKKNTVLPGASVTVKLCNYDYYITNVLDNQTVHSSAFDKRRKIYKALLVKVLGQEAQNATSGLPRFGKVHFRQRVQTQYEFRVAPDQRKIKVEYRHTADTGGLDKVITETTGSVTNPVENI